MNERKNIAVTSGSKGRVKGSSHKNSTPTKRDTMPKNASPNLYRLIKSLSPSEKRYYKLHIQNHTKGVLNTKLFDAINEDVEDEFSFDDNKLYTNLKAEFKSKKHYNTQKNRLMESILKVMQVKWLEHEWDIDSSLYGEIQIINFLISKSLFDQATDRLNMAIKKALKHERFIDLCYLIRLEQRISVGRGDPKAEKNANDLSEKMTLSMLKLNSYMKAMDIEQRTRQVLNEPNISQSRSFSKMKAFQALAKELSKEEDALRYSTEARLAKFNLEINILKEERTYSNYSTLNVDEIADRYEEYSKQLEPSGDKADPAKSFPEAYMRFLYLNSTASISASAQRGEAAVQKLAAFNSSNEYVNRHKDGYVLLCKLWLANEQLAKEKFDEAYGLYKDFKKTEIGVQPLIRMSIYHYLAFGFMLYNMLTEAKSVFRKTIELGKMNPVVRPDILIVALIGRLLIAHKERASRNMVNQLVREIRNYLKIKSIESVAYEMIFKYILFDIKGLATREDLLGLINQLKAYDKINSAPFEYFDYIHWFEAIFENIEFIDFVRRILISRQ